jgi:hypothetical protein
MDGWENSYVVGSIVLRGFYYERLQEGSRSYFLRIDKPHAYLFAHLVLASKFSMLPIQYSVKGGHSTYELQEEVLGAISDAIVSRTTIDALEIME